MYISIHHYRFKLALSFSCIHYAQHNPLLNDRLRETY